MNTLSFRRLLLLSAIAAPLPAFAATDVAQGDAAAVELSASSADALNDAGDEEVTSSSGNSIVVTARRREETAQNIPLAISVVGGAQIDNTGAFNVGRLQQLTPSINFFSSNPRNSAVNIRGIGVPFGLTNDGFDQGVGIYVDDVYFSRIASATLDFLDVAQIEVLRGPQGTLYGKNTTAGAINITTNQPTFDFEGKGELTVGNLNFKQAKLALSGPLSDTIAARLATSITSRRGTVFNVATGNWINGQDNIGLRGQLLWEAGENVTVNVSGDYSTQNPECCAQIYVREGATQRPVNRQYAALAAAQGYEVISKNPFDRKTDVDADLNAGNTIGGASIRVNWDTGAGDVTSISAWRFWDWLPQNDRDFTGLPITTVSQNPSQQTQFTQEFRYSHTIDQFDVLLGAFAFHQKVRTQGVQVQGKAASKWLINPTNPLSDNPAVLEGLTAENDIRLNNLSLALFGQVAFHVTDKLTIQPGLRLNYDKKDGLYHSVVTNAQGQLVTFESNDPWVVLQRAELAPQYFTPSFSGWNLSYDLTLSYQLARNVLVYGTYAKSFKPGGVNLNGVPNDSAGRPMDELGEVSPESVDHFEAGIKTEFWDRKATFNLAAFRTNIKDYQALVVNGQVGTLRGFLANAEKVRTQGIEADFSIRPSDFFNAYVSGAYTDAKYREFTKAPCPPERSGGSTFVPGGTLAEDGMPGMSRENCDISGQRLPGVSEWAVSFGAEVSAPATVFEQAGKIFVGYDGSYRSNFSSNPTPSKYTWVDGYHLSNLRAGFRSDNGLGAYVWVRNLFDAEYFEQLAVPSGNTGLIVGQPADPRTWGLTLTAGF